jgi:hypothetical protein
MGVIHTLAVADLSGAGDTDDHIDHIDHIGDIGDIGDVDHDVRAILGHQVHLVFRAPPTDPDAKTHIRLKEPEVTKGLTHTVAGRPLGPVTNSELTPCPAPGPAT